jgi:hypothetical protein
MIRGGKSTRPAFSNEESKSRQDMSLTLPPASRQPHISQSTTDSLVLPMPGFSAMVLLICSSRSSVIAGLFVILVPILYIFDMKLKSPAIF